MCTSTSSKVNIFLWNCFFFFLFFFSLAAFNNAKLLGNFVIFGALKTVRGKKIAEFFFARENQ